MTSSFDPTVSKELFVGRQAALDLFHQALRGELAEWIVHIPAPGGAGKTRLLERMAALCAESADILSSQLLIDFYKTTNQTAFGLLDDIVKQLGPERFAPFRAQHEQFRRFLTSEPDPGARQDAVNRVVDSFLACYETILRQGLRVVLLFDTCEEMRTVEPWVFQRLLPGIARVEARLRDEAPSDEPGAEAGERPFQTLVVIAGRKHLEFPGELRAMSRVLELEPLTDAEVLSFFRDGQIGPDEVSDAEVKAITDLSGGRPLFVALCFDWIRNRVGSAAELLAQDRPFGERLVSWVQRLQVAEVRAILYTALIWRRMPPALLAKLLGLEPEQAAPIIHSLSRFSFVKYRPPTEHFAGSFQLHDEMRDLLLKYVWPYEGPLTQQDLLTQAIEWYDAEIGDQELLEGKRLPPDEESRSLVAERLFYQARINLDAAVVAHELLFRNASHLLDLAFCELLNQEIWRFEPQLSIEQYNHMLFCEGLVAFRREQYSRANTLWSRLERRLDQSKLLRATTLMLLVELFAYTGRHDDAVRYAQEAEQIYRDHLAQAQSPEDGEQILTGLAQLYNNWGYSHRVRGQYDDALRCYEQAIQLHGRPKHQARVLNNMGFVYFLKGDLVEARTYIGRALQIRRQNGIAYELGLGYNTMGIVMEQCGRVDEAADLYHKAQSHFESANSERGQALVSVNLGRLSRIINKFEDAADYLERARAFFDGHNDTDNLVAVYNELGCLYRQRHVHNDWARAEEYLRRSLELSQSQGRIYDQADNLNDLATLFYRWGSQATQHGQEGAGQYFQRAQAYAAEADSIASSHSMNHLRAKNKLTLGDLAYDLGKYDQAFDEYLQACEDMAIAIAEGRESIVLLQRRFDQVVDRLQERLQGMDSLDQTLGQARRLQERINAMDNPMRTALETVSQFLSASLTMAERTRSTP